tara:strand:- start:1371 stop:2408 length:1038 start_codon:yes stop_codon:yes gene_type:complete
MSKRIPVTIITGFLGSGKTTLLRHLLENANRKLAVIVNEFGTVGLDGDVFRTCGFCPDDEIEGRLYELNNGCLCCTVQDDFLPTMETLLSHSESIDGIVIETSGLALPIPLVQALNWPEIRSQVFLNGVITVVDGEALSAGSPVADFLTIDKQRDADVNIDHFTSIEELFSDQLEVADLVIISRADLITSSLVSSVQDSLLSKVKTSTPIIPIERGVIEPSIVLGLTHSSNDFEINGHKSHNHLDVFTSSVRFECDLGKVKYEDILYTLVNEYQIIRLKGRIWLPNKSFPLQIQMVGERLDSWYEKSHQSFWRPSNCGIDLVVLSLKDCSKSQIIKAFQDCHIEA